MADSPGSSDLSDPPSAESDQEDQLSTAVPSSRPSVDIPDTDHLLPPAKRRKTGPSSLANLDRAPSSQPGADEEDNISVSSDGWSSAPGSPTHDEYAMRDEAQTTCLWKDCSFGDAVNNDELVKHVQGTHCAAGGPKKTKYVCEWGECQRKTSNHPSGYALKAHMRSHTKEKPYYCALPECDKAFTRSDALAKHMRTVHEPEPLKGEAAAPSKKPVKLKIINGTSRPQPDETGPTHDEDGNPVTPSGDNDNIKYIPAHHPVTGQPGFMITYPPDINFTSWESSVPANQLMRLLRRQLHWAQKEGDALKEELAELERIRKEEFGLKEILLEGVLEAELSRAEHEGLLKGVDKRVKQRMHSDIEPAKRIAWSGGTPAWRKQRSSRARDAPSDTDMPDAAAKEGATPANATPADRTPSPPPTGKSGGFDGDEDPYDNYLASRMAEYEARERMLSAQNTPEKAADTEGVREMSPSEERGGQPREVPRPAGEGVGRPEPTEREADAIGALVGMSGGS